MGDSPWDVRVKGTCQKDSDPLGMSTKLISPEYRDELVNPISKEPPTSSFEAPETPMNLQRAN